MSGHTLFARFMSTMVGMADDSACTAASAAIGKICETVVLLCPASDHATRARTSPAVAIEISTMAANTIIVSMRLEDPCTRTSTMSCSACSGWASTGRAPGFCGNRISFFSDIVRLSERWNKLGIDRTTAFCSSQPRILWELSGEVHDCRTNTSLFRRPCI